MGCVGDQRTLYTLVCAHAHVHAHAHAHTHTDTHTRSQNAPDTERRAECVCFAPLFFKGQTTHGATLPASTRFLTTTYDKYPPVCVRGQNFTKSAEQTKYKGRREVSKKKKKNRRRKPRKKQKQRDETMCIRHLSSLARKGVSVFPFFRAPLFFLFSRITSVLPRRPSAVPPARLPVSLLSHAATATAPLLPPLPLSPPTSPLPPLRN